MDSDPQESSADHGYRSRMVKSSLFHIWKKARTMYDMVGDDDDMEEWVREKVRIAYEALDEASRYTEYDQIFPPKEEVLEPGENNYLTNEDKRYPTPAENESGDKFVTRCISDPNMKQRYSEQSDRFSACMLIWNDSKQKPATSNPGEKFHDPMSPGVDDDPDPDQPILP